MIIEALEEHLPKSAELGVGDATGVDALIRKTFGSRAKVFEARWDDFGPQAGPLRNAEMAAWAAMDEEREFLCLAFPWHKSFKGTMSCITEATCRGIPVLSFPL